VLVSACGQIQAPLDRADAGEVADARVAGSGEPLRAPRDAATARSDAGVVIVAHDDPAIAAAIAAWNERHREEGDVPDPNVLACASRFDGMQILLLEGREFRRECQRCSTEDESDVCDRIGRIYACAPWEEPGRIVVDAAMAERQRTRDSLVVHEAIHHLGLCSGAGADMNHEVTERWCGRRNDCIEGEATAMLRGD
jgi:hypothetical protein